MAGSIALVSFGLDSVIEGLASLVIVWYSIATLGLRNSRIVILGSLLAGLTLPLYNEIAFGNPEAISYSGRGVTVVEDPHGLREVMGAEPLPQND